MRFSEKNVRSVVYNLLSNALKYRSPERLPQIGISCEHTPAYHVITVTDNGLGIPAGSLSQLFKMFKRFYDHVEGTGIGLYMIKRMVEQVGEILKWKAGKGTALLLRCTFPNEYKILFKDQT